MELKPQSLMVAIQCVAAQTKLLDIELTEQDPPNAAELEQLLVSFDLAADDLKNAYQRALERYDGLPPYESLIE
jgi:hypothetical protein